jgi:methyltransferase (TIGR00027 family)
MSTFSFVKEVKREVREVGSTAYAVAQMRALEAAKGPEKALVFDPYAQYLSSPAGEACFKEFMRIVSDNEKSSKAAWINFLAVRSRKIDDEIFHAIQAGFTQVVVLGSGLDTRPWRLHLQSSNPNLTGTMMSLLPHVQWFEVDFAEILDFKLGVLQAQNASTKISYHCVEADLTQATWVEKLQAHGYDSTLPTLWLMEGLVAYLTERECSSLLTTVKANSAAGSRLLATFVSPNEHREFSLFRFKPRNPLEFVSHIGWYGTQIDFADVAEKYKRIEPPLWRGYYFLNVLNT